MIDETSPTRPLTRWQRERIDACAALREYLDLRMPLEVERILATQGGWCWRISLAGEPGAITLSARDLLRKRRVRRAFLEYHGIAVRVRRLDDLTRLVVAAAEACAQARDDEYGNEGGEN